MRVRLCGGVLVGLPDSVRIPVARVPSAGTLCLGPSSCCEGGFSWPFFMDWIFLRLRLWLSTIVPTGRCGSTHRGHTTQDTAHTPHAPGTRTGDTGTHPSIHCLASAPLEAAGGGEMGGGESDGEGGKC